MSYILKNLKKIKPFSLSLHPLVTNKK